jgi:hypothetical protein
MPKTFTNGPHKSRHTLTDKETTHDQIYIPKGP